MGYIKNEACDFQSHRETEIVLIKLTVIVGNRQESSLSEPKWVLYELEVRFYYSRRNSVGYTEI